MSVFNETTQKWEPYDGFGWSEPDSHGNISYTTKETGMFNRRADAPKAPEGYEYFFIARHGENFTRHSYKPVAA